MIEVCGWCQQSHETGGGLIGGISFKTCPSIPEDTFVPMNKVPVVIHGPQGEVFESYRYVLAGMPTSVAGDVDVMSRQIEASALPLPSSCKVDNSGGFTGLDTTGYRCSDS